MITCTKCGQPKPDDSFPWRNKAKGVRKPCCKECKRAYNRVHYQLNMPYYKAKAAAHRGNTHRARKRFIWDYLSTHPCVLCGESDPIVLEFDHLDPATKSFNVSSSFRCVSLQLLEAEIKKCRVLCANCHRRETATQFGWWSEFS